VIEREFEVSMQRKDDNVLNLLVISQPRDGCPQQICPFGASILLGGYWATITDAA